MRWYSCSDKVPVWLGLMHLDVAVNARRDITQAEAERLLAALRDVPRPVLVH